MKSHELSRLITELTEDMEELKSEKALLLLSFDKSDDAGMKEIREWITSMETSLQKAEQADIKFSGELDAAIAEYKELAEQAAELDVDEVNTARQKLRPLKTDDAVDRIKAAYGKQYDYKRMQQAKAEVTVMLDEKAPLQERQSIRQQLRETEKRQEQSTQRPRECEQER